MNQQLSITSSTLAPRRRCSTLGWVPPGVKFDHQWDDTGGWDDD
jgi:hypothetical protein